MEFIVSCTASRDNRGGQDRRIEKSLDLPHNESVNIGDGYLDKIKTRRKESARVSRPYQLIGLEIADILGDRRHKALYIKLAKEKNALELLRLAKEVAEQRSVRNPGAYFMAVVTGSEDDAAAEIQALKARGRTPIARSKK